MSSRRRSFDVSALHAALDSERRSRDLAWKDVAEESGVSASTFSRLSQGRQPDVNSLTLLTRWLGMPADRFMKIGQIGQFGAASPLAQITSILHGDPNLSPEATIALEELIRATYSRLRIDKNQAGD